ncbi:MAG: response regulator [Elusimicrobia bacterium]|nr:response regulator [Elusimicrobiota bacterium]
MNRIAAVEDDSMMQKLLQAMFEGTGLRLSIYGDGRSALSGISAEPPDLVILDINLPDMNGHEVCRCLQAHPRTRGIAVLMLTGEARKLESRVLGLELGADDYLFKPISPKVLIARVRSILKAARRG